MRKIFLYELRRAALSKLTVGLMVVCLFLGWQTLTTETIQGVGFTAPFSAWSFASYLARVMPVLACALPLMLYGMFAGRARGTAALTGATPADPARYLLVRCAAAAAAWLLLALAVWALGAAFLKALFGGAARMRDWALPALVVPLPALSLALGLGALAGPRRPGALLLLVPLLLLADFVPGPALCKLYGGAFFAAQPLAAGALDPAFRLPAAAWALRALYAAAGLALLALAARRARKAQGRA